MRPKPFLNSPLFATMFERVRYGFELNQRSEMVYKRLLSDISENNESAGTDSGSRWFEGNSA